MTEITLRAYVREIDGLIEQENLDEAIAHCRHLLQRHPKYIECYRLLGKAYLEAKRFGDAADIFQRVLSTVPDDFVSHIGMSIVREDEGNLDSAIWHMERAFETNPANPAIQQELKRLIGRRDGFEPHKVRLTRGALARMYAHGELFPQAIAELQSALDEHSDRPDLQVLLAKLLWQTDQRTEAADVSSGILEKLPYCLQATRIMAAVLQHRGKTEDATAYHRRLAQLDPYMAYTESPMTEPVRVDADTIMVQKLAWKPGQPLPSTETAPADWAASLGLDDESSGPGTGPLPSWLDDVESPQPTPAEVDDDSQPFDEMAEQDLFAEAEPTKQPANDLEELDSLPEPDSTGVDIPNWMEDAGWQESTGEVEEQPVSFSTEELDQLERGELPAEPSETAEPTGELEPAEIPGWLQGMAPGDETESDADDDELEAILQADSSPGEQPEDFDFEQASEEIADDEAVEDAQDVPGWLDEGEPGATSTIMTWLGDRDQEEGGPEEPEMEVAAEAEEETLPEAEEDQEVPSWLSGVAQAAADSESAEESELAEFREQTSRSQIEPEPVESEKAETGDVPEWLQNITGEIEVDDLDTVSDQELEQIAADLETDQPWEAEVEAAEQETIPQEDLIEDTFEASSLELADEPVDEIEVEPSATEETVEAEEEEDWLAGLGEAPVEEAEELPEEATWLEELTGEDTFGVGAEAAAPSWMEGLAEEEPDEDEVEARASSWLDDLSETIADTPAEPGEAVTDESLEWLDEGEEEPETITPESIQSEEIAEEDDLTWLRDMEEAEQPAQTSQTEAPPPAAELDDIDEEGVFDWLDQMAAQQDQQPVQAEDPVEVPQQTAESEISEEAPPETFEEGLDWLDRLSETRGIDADIEREPAAGTISGRLGDATSASEPAEPDIEAEAEVESQEELSDWEPEIGDDTASAEMVADEEVPSEVVSPEEQEEVPTWLLSHAEQEEPESLAPDPVPAEGEEVPDWLQQAEADIAEPTVDPSESEASTETPQWLQDEYGEQEPISEPISAEPSSEETPDWLLAHTDSEGGEEQPVTLETESKRPAAEPSIPSSSEAPPVSDEPSESIPGAEEVPEWLEAQAEEFEPEAPSEQAKPVEATQIVADSTEPELDEPSGLGAETPDEETAPDAEYTTETIHTETGVPAETTETEPSAQPVVASQDPSSVEEDAAAIPDKTKEEPATAPPPDQFAPARQALARGDVAQAAEYIAEFIKDRKSVDETVTMLEEHLAEDPDAPTLWQLLGDAYMRLNKTDKAVRAYDRGMEESEVFDSARQALAASDFERAAAQYGMLIKNKKRLEVVIQDLEQAVEGDKSDPRIWQILGDAYMKADRIDDSIEAYRKGMDSV